MDKYDITERNILFGQALNLALQEAGQEDEKINLKDRATDYVKLLIELREDEELNEIFRNHLLKRQGKEVPADLVKNQYEIMKLCLNGGQIQQLDWTTYIEPYPEIARVANEFKKEFKRSPEYKATLQPRERSEKSK